MSADMDMTTEELQRAILRGRAAVAQMEVAQMEAQGADEVGDRILALVRAKQDRLEREYRARVLETAERKGLRWGRGVRR